MKYDAILISGTPSSGKDTLSDELFVLKNELVSFTKHKGSNGENKTGNYHYISISQFKDEITKGNFIQYHERYGNYYGIHKAEIEKILDAKKIPVIHVGKYENLRAIMKDERISNPLSILFFVAKEQTKRRLEVRHVDDEAEINQRLQAYDEEISQLRTAFNSDQKLLFHSVFINNYESVEQAGKALLKTVESSTSTDYIKLTEIETILNNE